MFDIMHERVMPYLEQLDRQVKELQLRFNQPPKIELEIDADDTDKLIIDLQKLYQNFGATCNLQIKIKLNNVEG